MSYASATISTTIYNTSPCISFLLAVALGLEKINMRERMGMLRISGSILSIIGAMVMTLSKLSTNLSIVLLKGEALIDVKVTVSTPKDVVMGATILGAACLCSALNVNLQGITLKVFPRPLTIAALVCLIATIQGGAMAWLVVGWPKVWAMGVDARLVYALYASIIGSGVALVLQGLIIRERGPVFSSSFSPMSMILVTAGGMMLLNEDLFVGGVIGAAIILTGLAMFTWGTSHTSSRSSSNNNNEQSCIVSQEAV